MHQSCFDSVLDLFPQNFKQLISSQCKYEELLLDGYERFRFILLLVRGDKENETVLVLQILNKDGEVSQVIRYNIVDQSFQVLDLPRQASSAAWRRAFPYMESLASPAGDRVASPESTYRMCVTNYLCEVEKIIEAMNNTVSRMCVRNYLCEVAETIGAMIVYTVFIMCFGSNGIINTLNNGQS
ncbi:hypothetical protein DM860_016494 [Cuscuta australis]|uniref:Uncharacterized protein n=1 Tax=Cuscuta australis TaxID=267555 RepID=A0A328E3K2_9ASTE|nr:hypothetical protein DM860_016494 [Cuscuta australis]